jgi:Zn-dependent protease
MDTKVRLGRVLGIEIDAHWSLLLIAGLILLGLATNVLPALDAGRSDLAYWLAATVMVVAFYAALVAHEVAHSVVARRRGIDVERITLWLFGGVSELSADSGSAADELRIAIVGPVTSLVVGTAFVGLAGVTNAFAGLDLVTAGLAWLGVINVFLGVFNLLPAFPLDGGRVLRAALWAWRDDEMDATQIAGTVSEYTAFALLGVGVLAFLAGAGLSGLWLAILGWFVFTAGRAETSEVLARGALTGVSVGDVMSPHPVAVSDRVTVSELIERFVLGHPYSSFPVVDGDGHPIGLVTLDSIRHVPPAARGTARVGDVMVPMQGLVVVAPELPAGDATICLLSSGSRRALVTSGPQLVGILSLTDLVRAVDQRRLVPPGRAGHDSGPSPVSGPPAVARHRSSAPVGRPDAM